jgi:hypothetical protein
MKPTIERTKRFRLPYGSVDVPASILPVAARRVAGLGAGSFALSTPQQTAMGAYLQGIEDCYTALEHAGIIAEKPHEH